MMGIYKKVFLLLLTMLITGSAFAEPGVFIAELNFEDFLSIINNEEKTHIIDKDISKSNFENIYEINRYRNIGFEYSGKIFGISIAITEENANIKQKKTDREMTKSLASRAIAIPEIEIEFRNSELPQKLQNEYIKYQIMKGTEFEVEKTFRIKFFEKETFLGYIYIVEKSDMKIQSIRSEKDFLRDLIKTPRKYAEKNERITVVDTFEYCLKNPEKLELEISEEMQLRLYLSALYLKEGRKEEAVETLNRLPENMAEIFAFSGYDDEDYLLLGDMHIIFENEQKAFSAWAYGMQKNPLNSDLEERFEKYGNMQI